MKMVILLLASSLSSGLLAIEQDRETHQAGLDRACSDAQQFAALFELLPFGGGHQAARHDLPEGGEGHQLGRFSIAHPEHGVGGQAQRVRQILLQADAGLTRPLALIGHQHEGDLLARGGHRGQVAHRLDGRGVPGKQRLEPYPQQQGGSHGERPPQAVGSGLGGDPLRYPVPDLAGQGRGGLRLAQQRIQMLLPLFNPLPPVRIAGHQAAHPGLHPRAQGTQHILAGEPLAQGGVSIAFGGH